MSRWLFCHYFQLLPIVGSTPFKIACDTLILKHWWSAALCCVTGGPVLFWGHSHLQSVVAYSMSDEESQSSIWGDRSMWNDNSYSWAQPPVCIPSANLMSSHVTKSPRHFPSVLLRAIKDWRWEWPGKELPGGQGSTNGAHGKHSVNTF